MRSNHIALLLFILGFGCILFAYSAQAYVTKWDDPALLVVRPFQPLARLLGLALISSTFISLSVFTFSAGPQLLIRSAIAPVFCALMLLRSLTSLLHDVPVDWPNVFIWSSGWFISTSVCKPALANPRQIMLVGRYVLLTLSMLLCVLNLLLFVFIGYSAGIVHDGRFLGSFAHPQFAGLAFAVTSIIFFECILNPEKLIDLPQFKLVSHRSRQIVLAAFGVLSLYLLFNTGSRTGLLSFLVGFSCATIYYLRKGKTTILFFASSIFLILALLINHPLMQSFLEARVFNTELNTREEAWLDLVKVFIDNPIIGDPTKVFSSESSVLVFAGSMGLIGLSLFFYFSIRIFKRVFTYLPSTNTARSLIYSPAILIAVYVSTFSEGQFAMDTFSFPLYAVFIYLISFDMYLLCTRQSLVKGRGKPRP